MSTMAHFALQILLFMAVLCWTTFALPKKFSADKKVCGKNPLDDMDELISSVMPFGNANVKPPTKVEELPNFCSYYGKALHQVETTNKRCVKGNYKNLINVLLFSVKKHTKEVCNKRALDSKELTPKKRDFLQMGSCINSGADRLVTCANISKNKLLAIENAEKAHRLPLLCCEVLKMKQCFLKTLTAQPDCNNEEAAQKVKDFVDNFGASSISAACGEFKSLEKCQKEGLVYPKLQKSQRVPRTFIVPILSVISGI